MAVEKQLSPGPRVNEEVLMESTTPYGTGTKPDGSLAKVQEVPLLSQQNVSAQPPVSMGVLVSISESQGMAIKNGKMSLTGVWTNSKTETPGRLETITTEKQSVTTPNFRELVRIGAILPVNDFTHSRKVVKHNFITDGSIVMQLGGISSRTSRIGPFYNATYPLDASGDGLGPTASQMEVLDRKARMKLRLRLKDQKVNVAMIVAERNKTAAGLAKIVKTIAEMVIALRRGNIQGAAKAAGAHVGYRATRTWKRDFVRDSSKAVANGWLELQYAIKPLLMDAKGLAEALAEHQYRKITGTVSANAELITDKAYQIGLQKYTETGTTSIRYTVYYQIDLPEMPDLAGLGLLNPAQLAWEVIPFSFVLDWFIPVGDWLSSLDATIGMSFSDGAKSVKRDHARSIRIEDRSDSVKMNQYGPVRTVRYAIQEKSFSENSVVRTKLTSFPDVATPVFDFPDSLQQFYSALALLRKQARF